MRCYYELMIENRIKTMEKSDWIVLALISLIVGFCTIFGASYVLGKGWPILSFYAEILLSLLISPVYGLIFIVLEVPIRNNAIKAAQESTFIGPPAPTKRGKLVRAFSKLTPKFTAKSICGFAILMAILWLPWYIANFPGGTYWDTYYQIFQVYPENHPIAIIPWSDVYNKTLTDAWLVDHHPIFTTLVYGAFGWVSDQLTGNWMAGVAVFCILQGLAHNFIFTSAVAYMRKIGCPTTLSFISYWFFAIMPFISTWALCMVKDSFMGLFYVPYFLFVFEVVRTRGKIMRRPRNAVLFTICALLVCLTKKTGIFVVVITAAIGIIVLARQIHKQKRSSTSNANPDKSDTSKETNEQLNTMPNSSRRNAVASIKAFAAQALVCCLTLLVIFPYALFPVLNIQSGGLQETLGPLFQQTARYIVDYEDDVSIKERNIISKVISYERIEKDYEFDFEDSVKFRYKLNASTEDLLNYLQVYMAQGLRHPDAYFAAIMSLAGFYVSPTAYINIRMVTVDTKMGEEDRYMLWNPKELDSLRNGLDEAYTAVAEIPGLDIPLLIVTYAFWLPTFLIFVVWRNRLKGLTLFIPPLVLLGFCILAPVYDARYVIPIFDAAPLFLCGIVVLVREAILRQKLSVSVAPSNQA